MTHRGAVGRLAGIDMEPLPLRSLCSPRPAAHRLAAFLAVVALATMVGGCGMASREYRERKAREANVALAGGPTAMWYRFRFAGTYRGDRFLFNQYVHCGLRTIPGGAFDSAPATTNRAMYPRTVGRKMADGSYVVVRVPDMCRTYRAIDAGQLMQAGWESRGPFEVLPLVIWNDRRPQTTTIERYVARGYYTQPGARITDPRGSVELMPAGFHPADYEAILAQPEFATTDPEENTDPRTGKRFRNVYASNNNGLVGFYTVPTADMAAALARLDDPPGKIARDVDLARIEQLQAGAIEEVQADIRHTRAYLGVPAGQPATLKPAAGPTGADIAMYEDSRYYDDDPFTYDPTYLPPMALWRCIADLAAGVPVMSTVPIGRGPSAGLLHPMWIARALARETIARQRGAAACEALVRLVSYDVRDGRLDATGAIPGAIVRRQWQLTGSPSSPTQLERLGAARRVFNDRRLFDYHFRFGAADADLRLEEPRYILHDRKDGRWLALFRDYDRIVTDRSVEGGW